MVRIDGYVNRITYRYDERDGAHSAAYDDPNGAHDELDGSLPSALCDELDGVFPPFTMNRTALFHATRYLSTLN